MDDVPAFLAASARQAPGNAPVDDPDLPHVFGARHLLQHERIDGQLHPAPTG